MINIVNGLSTLDGVCSMIPEGIINLIKLVITAFQVVVPILLIIWGMLDFAKAVIAQDEAKTKEAQKVFVRRIIAAVVVFLMVTIVTFVLSIVSQIGGSGNDATEAQKCIQDIVG